MTTIDTFPVHSGTLEKEQPMPSRVEDIEAMKENSLDLHGEPLEVRGDFSRVATFEIGSNVDDEGRAAETIDPANPHAVVLDLWASGDKVFALPRAVEVDAPEDIARKGWDMADWPTGLPIGRERNDIWQEKTGQNLPREVSSRHFGIAVKDGKLLFADMDSTNGTRIEKPVPVSQPERADVEETAPRGRVFSKVTRDLVKVTDRTENASLPDTRGAVTDTSPEHRHNSTETQLQSMQNLARNWEATLVSQPTFTHSDQLHGVGASMSGDMAALQHMREAMNPLAGSSIDRALSEIEGTATQAQVLASVIASNIESGAYSSGAEAHAARRQVEGLLHRYSDSISELQRLINK